MSVPPPRIVILDGYTLTHGDLTWEALQRWGECTAFDRTELSDIVPRSLQADLVLTNKAPLSREAIEQLPQLKYIGVTATGTNAIDLAAARERGICVTYVPGYGTASVAQMVFTHLLNLAQRVADLSTAVRSGRWATAPDFCFWDAPLVELDGLTMGVIGLGQIGRAVAQLAHGFGMRVLAHTRTMRDHPDFVHLVDIDTLLRESDVVSLHCQLTPDTQELINSARLALMKRTAFLINTSRGPLIDEQALAEALADGRLAGAGLDVLSQEPPPRDHPLLAAPNCYITPHMAWGTRAARSRLMAVVVENVVAFLQGRPQNVV